MKNITIIGCGHGGQILAYDLTQKGCKVTLAALPDHPGYALDLMKSPQITVTGMIKGSCKLHLVTTDLALALKDAEIVFIVVPSFAQEQVLLACMPHLQANQWVVTLEANFSSLVYVDLLKRLNFHKQVYFADISTLPYACRSTKPGEVIVLGIKKKMGVAAIPCEKTEYIANELNKVYPSQLQPYNNVLEIGLNSLSGIIHPAVTLCNAGRIGKEEFYFYKDGISPAVGQLLEQLDQERRHIGKLYDLNLPHSMIIEEEFYGIKYNNIYDFFFESEIHSGTFALCPKSLKERYISQDVPYVLVPWYALGTAVGYQARVTKSLIDMASALNGTDYLADGRNLAHMNCHDLNKSELINYASHGQRYGEYRWAG